MKKIKNYKAISKANELQDQQGINKYHISEILN